MPSKTKKQRKAMGMALAIKKGKVSKAKAGPAVQKMLHMSVETLKEFARKGKKILDKKAKK